MSRPAFILSACLALLLMACPARSFFPLFAEKDLVMETNLEGAWVDPTSNETWTFHATGNGYTMVGVGHEGDTITYYAQLGKLGKSLFMDTYPAAGDGDHHNVAMHIFSKLHLHGDSLSMASLESDRLRDMLDAKKLTIPHVRRDDDIILTATTEQLQALVLRLADDTLAFPDPDVLVRLK